MNPPFSVIFLTTLIGVGQGLFIALFSVEAYGVMHALPKQDNNFYAYGSLISMVFLILGLIASFFHLGHPERAWRAATQWRTSWLSREVIALPIFMFFVFLYGALHYFGISPPVFGSGAIEAASLTVLVGFVGVIVCVALFVCTGMIYACLKFLQEWHTPLTPINYTLLGTASGFTIAAAFAQVYEAELVNFLSIWAIILTLTAFITRAASLVRNLKLKHKSTLQTAIGVRHNRIQQKAQGSMGGSFNTREFFHGKNLAFLKSIKWIFLVLVFPLPVLLLLGGIGNPEVALFFQFAFVVQYLGLIAERWFFFAQANHPQNLYYQTI